MSLESLNKLYNLGPFSRSFNDKSPKVLDELRLKIFEGQLNVVLGPSGSGKSTLFKMIYEDLLKSGVRVSLLEQNDSQRKINKTLNEFLFEKFENKNNKEKCIEKIREFSDLFHLEYFDQRSVSSLSGGEFKRLEIFKSIINSPQILLLDEPFNGLDPVLRKETQEFLKLWIKKANRTVILSSHLEQEALSYADIVSILDKGKINQTATPEEIFCHPVDGIQSSYFGLTNTLVLKVNKVADETYRIESPFGNFEKNFTNIDINHGFHSFDLKPINFIIQEKGQFKGKVEKKFFMGNYSILEINHMNKKYYSFIENRNNLKNILPGVQVRFNVNLEPLTPTLDIRTEI